MNRPPVRTKYVKARLLGSPGVNLSWLDSSYDISGVGFFTVCSTAVVVEVPVATSDVVIPAKQRYRISHGLRVRFGFYFERTVARGRSRNPTSLSLDVREVLSSRAMTSRTGLPKRHETKPPVLPFGRIASAHGIATRDVLGTFLGGRRTSGSPREEGPFLRPVHGGVHFTRLKGHCRGLRPCFGVPSSLNDLQHAWDESSGPSAALPSHGGGIRVRSKGRGLVLVDPFGVGFPAYPFFPFGGRVRPNPPIDVGPS